MRVRPRLLYIGDIGVEHTHHSAAQLYRLLTGYPADRLRIIETRDRPSSLERRLPGVHYTTLPIANRRWLADATRGAHAVWFADSLPLRMNAVRRAVGDFRPDAILTITSGLGWLLADALARDYGIPLHLIAHDDWPKLPASARLWEPALRRRFHAVYRRAQSRLCVSPYMVSAFAHRYGTEGTVLYPIRQDGARALPASVTRSAGMSIGYCGGSGAHVMPGLRSLARAAAALRARVVAYGPFDTARREDLSRVAPVFEFRGFADYGDMCRGLSEADALFVPLAFDEASRENMKVSFPSKLVEYTMVSVPTLIYAPPDTAAVQWARDHASAATVESDSVDALVDGLRALRNDPTRRADLVSNAQRAGDAFSFERGREIFGAALG